MSDTPVFLTHPALNNKKSCHGFFTREGGVSAGLFSSLNCRYKSKDDPENIRENLRRVADASRIAPQNLLTCRQIHSSHVLTVEKPWPPHERPEADGMVTTQKGFGLGILTADCAPVLFHDEKAGVAGAAHAGWKGARRGVMENTLAAMEKLGASRQDIRAVIGPCIQQNSYEVGPEFMEDFLKQDRENGAFFKKSEKPGHFLFDLPGYCRRRLKWAGVETHSLGLDTCSDEARFFSYRRRTLRGEPTHGTLVSVIALA